MLKSNKKLWELVTESAHKVSSIDSFNEFLIHEMMLADRVRVEAYHSAISKYVKPGDTVIDLGTGTGILAFFAAKKGAKKVYAIDHSGIISTAEKVAAYNNIKNIEFRRTHSKKFTLDTPVDIIIHEQMGSFLFNERMVDNISDLRDRLLVKDGIIIPNRFEFYIEPVKIKDGYQVPFLWDQKINDIDFSCLNIQRSQKFRNNFYSRHSSTFEFFLCHPQPIYCFDLQTISPADLPSELSYSRKVINGGRLDGFVVYFRCFINEDFFLSTSPMENIDSNIHWLHFILRVRPRIYEKGEPIFFELKIEESLSVKESWWWNYR